MDFRLKVEQLIENLEKINGYEEECQQLRQINLVIYKTGIIDEQHIETYEKIKNNVKIQQKQYIYNKTGQLTRSRQKRQTVQQYCQNCQTKLISFFQCQECGTKIIHEQKTGQKPQDKIEKFQQFMTYFQGICSVPYFICNYLNKVLLEEEINDQYNHIKIKFPFTCQVMNKKRSDIQKNTFQVDNYQERQMCIPIWSFKDFKNIMKSYREKSKDWQFSSYLPRDAIYLPALYIGFYDLSFQLFSDNDKEEMISIYKKILIQRTERRNEFTIFHVLTGLIMYLPQFNKYNDYLYLVKSKQINSDLKKILCPE